MFLVECCVCMVLWGRLFFCLVRWMAGAWDSVGGWEVIFFFIFFYLNFRESIYIDIHIYLIIKSFSFHSTQIYIQAAVFWHSAANDCLSCFVRIADSIRLYFIGCVLRCIRSRWSFAGGRFMDDCWLVLGFSFLCRLEQVPIRYLDFSNRSWLVLLAGLFQL